MNASYRKFITDDLATIRSQFDFQDEHLFAMWVLAIMHYERDFGESALEEIYQSSYALLEEGMSGDHCLDAFHYDKDTTTLYLYQTKWPNSPTKKATAGEARQVAQALKIVQHDAQASESLPESRANVVQALKDVKEEGGRIVLRGITGGKWATQHKDRVRECIPDEFMDITIVELFGLEELRQHLSEREEDLKGIAIPISVLAKAADPILIHPDEGVKGMGDSIVTLLSALSVAKIAQEYGQRLFERNVRLYLGRGRVNKDMEDTLRDDAERQSFWYGHNGITILCDDFKVVGPSPKPKSVLLTNPQIVNGCQTATTLARVLGASGSAGDIEDFAVMSRIIKLRGSKRDREYAAELIAYRTNSQAAVNDADLRANDPHQRHLQNILEPFGRNWFYERKRGEWKNLPGQRKQKFRARKKADRVIARDLYQQAWRAYTGRPAEAIVRKNAVWVRGSGQGGDLYGEVFDMERRACDVILVSRLLDWFAQIFGVRHDGGSLCFDIHNGLKGHGSDIRRAKMLIAAHCLALFGSMVEEAYGDVAQYPEASIKRIVNSLDSGRFVRKRWSNSPKSWKAVEKPIETIMQSLANYISAVMLRKESLYASLKRPQEKAFEELKASLNTNMQTSALDILKPA